MRPFGNPILGRELALISRNWRVAALVAIVSAISGGAAVLYIIASGSGQTAGGLPLRTGINMFSLLATLQLGMVLLIAPGLTAGAISTERERNTLEPLLQTGLSPLAFALGKLGGAIAYLCLLLVAASPSMGLLFLLGGVSLRPMLLVYGVCLASGMLLASLGLCISALSSRTQAAAAVSYVLTAVIVAGTALPTWMAGDLLAAWKGNEHAVLAVASANPVAALASVAGGPFFSPVLSAVLGPVANTWQVKREGSVAGSASAPAQTAFSGGWVPPAYAAMGLSQSAAPSGILVAPVPLVTYGFLSVAGGGSLLMLIIAVLAARPRASYSPLRRTVPAPGRGDAHG